tara:strand:+ start:5784 stop:6671 length:888 start_codon:yes stop_codon:yes gene_type:complete
MIRTSRKPGNFTHVMTDRRHIVRTGWRRFNFNDGDNFAAEDPRVVLGSITENSNSTSFVFANQTAATNGESPINGYSRIRPLTDGEGRQISWTEPFTIKLRIEAIAVSGGYQSGTEGGSGTANLSKPQVAFGLTNASSDLDNTDNEYVGIGWRLKCDSSGSDAADHHGVGLRLYKHASSDQHSEATQEYNSGASVSIFEGSIFYGPDGDFTKNCNIITQAFGDSSDDFSVNGTSATKSNKDTDLNTHQADMGTGQVYLWAAVHDCHKVNSSNACTFQFRLSYMVEADVSGGWGTA